MKQKVLLCLVTIFLCTTPVYGDTVTGQWGLHFEKNSNQPEIIEDIDYLTSVDTYYRDLSGEKVIYLTFDAGYEAGYTEQMLDTLNKYNAHGTFFLTASYIKNNPSIVLRMVEENHTVANHTVTHPDMSRVSPEQFEKELIGVEEIFFEITETQLPKYFRPPQGAYDKKSLERAKDLGYKTVFWSLAYRDYDENNQPSHSYAYDKLIPNIHEGAIVLLHNMSRTNAEILDGLLEKYLEMGYIFVSLENFIAPY